MIVAGADYTAHPGRPSETKLTVIDIDAQALVLTMDITGDGAVEVAEHVAALCKQHKADIVCVDVIGFGSGLFQALQWQGVNVVAVRPGIVAP